MFTLLPSLYIIAVHYFRQWNAPYYYEENIHAQEEEETKTYRTCSIHEDNHIELATNVQSSKSMPSCDNNPVLLHDNKETLIIGEQLTRSNLVKKNGYLSKSNNDEDEQLAKLKLRVRKPLRSSSLLNVGRQKTYTNDLCENDIIHLMNETGFTREQILLWHSDFLVRSQSIRLIFGLDVPFFCFFLLA